MFVLVLFMGSKLFVMVSAHPLDQTFTNIFFNTDQNRKLLPNDEIRAEIYISWQEMSYIHEKYLGKKLDAQNFDSQIRTFYTTPNPHRNYVSENIEFKNNDQDCDITNINEKKYVKNEVLVGKGIGLDLTIKCLASPIENIEFLNRMFLDDFPYQLHNVTFYSYNKLVKNDELSKDHINTKYPEIIDTKIKEKDLSQNRNLFTKFFEKFSESIKTPTIYTFIALFLVGFLHSLEAGHSKTLIVISTGSSRKKLLHMFKFVGIFVVTHVSDILLLSFLLLVSKPFINAYSLAGKLERYSLYALIAISVYQFIKSFYELKKHDHHEHGDGEDLKVAFLTGLAPCAMGWSIFMLILGSGINVFQIVLYILTFALGISTALFVIYYIAAKLTGSILSKFEKYSHFAPIITYALLLIFSIVKVFIG